MKTPRNLSHTPIVAIDDYSIHDGIYKDNTDAQSLSIGFAQYDKSEISAKVFRFTGNRWSPQSEELPLHRVIDLSSTILKSILQSSKIITPNTSLQLTVIDEQNLPKIADYYKDIKEDIYPKLQELQILLNYFMQEESKI